MPTPSPHVDYRDYYGRFIAAFRHDLFKLGAGQVIGALLTIGILVLQIRYGVISQSLTRRTVASIAWPYLLVIIGLSVLSWGRTAAHLDAERQEKINELTDKLALPDQALAEYLRGKLAQLTDNARKFLRIAVLHDVFDSRLIAVKDLSFDEIWEASKDCKAVGLLTIDWEDVDTTSPLAIANMRLFCRVPSEFRETLKRLLYE